MARRRADVAAKLEALGYDPVTEMTRIAELAERKGNLSLAAKIAGDLLEFTAPKLKAMEHSIEPETMDFLDRQQRLNRIAELLKTNPELLTVLQQKGLVEEGEVQVLKHVPDEA